jgi:hypothetical protein
MQTIVSIPLKVWSVLTADLTTLRNGDFPIPPQLSTNGISVEDAEIGSKVVVLLLRGSEKSLQTFKGKLKSWEETGR